MASQSEPDPELCRRYAQFASHPEPWQVKVIYWTLLMTNLVILFLASGQAALERYPSRTDQRARRLRTCIVLCLACVVASTPIVVMETYALLALQFCAGEDLIMLYWSTWTMTQVGSLVAMLGIVLALSHSLHDRKHPPWALALGTPVLVIAGVLHFFHECAKKSAQKLRRKPSADASDGPPMSQESTIEASPEDEDAGDVHAELIGLTVEGRPIVRFLGPLPTVPGHGEILGFGGDKEAIVALRGGVIRVGANQAIARGAEMEAGRLAESGDGSTAGG